MVRRNRRSLMALMIGAASITACSDQSPVMPTANDDFAVDLARVASVPGSYELSFWHNGQPVSTLPTGGPSLILKAHVQQAVSGAAAQSGSVTFQYCSRKSGPSNDITRADELPSSECQPGGAGSWARLQTVDVNASGDAFIGFGSVTIPRTIGYRFRYAARRSGIADGVSAERDFTWVAP